MLPIGSSGLDAESWEVPLLTVGIGFVAWKLLMGALALAKALGAFLIGQITIAGGALLMGLKVAIGEIASVVGAAGGKFGGLDGQCIDPLL